MVLFLSAGISSRLIISRLWVIRPPAFALIMSTDKKEHDHHHLLPCSLILGYSFSGCLSSSTYSFAPGEIPVAWRGNKNIFFVVNAIFHAPNEPSRQKRRRSFYLGDSLMDRTGNAGVIGPHEHLREEFNIPVCHSS